MPAILINNYTKNDKLHYYCQSLLYCLLFFFSQETCPVQATCICLTTLQYEKIDVLYDNNDVAQACSGKQALYIMRNKTNKCIYKYVNLLYNKQHSLLHVSVTYCSHLQGGVLLRIHYTEFKKKNYKFKMLSFK